MSAVNVMPAMRETNRIFEEEVIGESNFDALDRVYTSDARILPPGAELVSGREGIKQFWRGAVAAMGVTSGKLETVDAEQVGDTIIEIGRAELTLANGAAASVKYVVIWKQENGAWKWHIDIWNPNA